jgi:modulator of FtsH protease HflC
VKRNLPLVLAGLIVLCALYSALFVVDQRQTALVLTGQKVTRVITDPGLHLKWPAPIDQVVLADHRIETLDSASAERYVTADKVAVVAELVVRFQVTDPQRFFPNASTPEQSRQAREHLVQAVRTALSDEFGRHSLPDILAGHNGAIVAAIRDSASPAAEALGLNLVSVGLARVDLVPELSERVYQRMVAERTRLANELRSTGAADEEQIKADADRQVEVIKAEAYQTAQNTKGDGDARAAQIYSEAYSRDPQFYAFYKSLEAYRESFRNRSDVVIADPNSDFFRFMRNPAAGGAPRK